MGKVHTQLMKVVFFPLGVGGVNWLKGMEFGIWNILFPKKKKRKRKNPGGTYDQMLTVVNSGKYECESLTFMYFLNFPRKGGGVGENLSGGKNHINFPLSFGGPKQCALPFVKRRKTEWVLGFPGKKAELMTAHFPPPDFSPHPTPKTEPRTLLGKRQLLLIPGG